MGRLWRRLLRLRLAATLSNRPSRVGESSLKSSTVSAITPKPIQYVPFDELHYKVKGVVVPANSAPYQADCVCHNDWPHHEIACMIAIDGEGIVVHGTHDSRTITAKYEYVTDFENGMRVAKNILQPVTALQLLKLGFRRVK